MRSCFTPQPMLGYVVLFTTGWLVGDPCIPDGQGWAGVVCFKSNSGDLAITYVGLCLTVPAGYRGKLDTRWVTDP